MKIKRKEKERKEKGKIRKWNFLKNKMEVYFFGVLKPPTTKHFSSYLFIKIPRGTKGEG